MGIGTSLPTTCDFPDVDVDPASRSSAASSAWILMSPTAPVGWIVTWGDIASTGTLDAKLEQATDGTGTGAKDITGKAITQQADTDDNGKAVLTLSYSEMDTGSSFIYALTPATAASVCGAAFVRYWNGVPQISTFSSDAEVL
jgi:hypothetical protein